MKKKFLASLIAVAVLEVVTPNSALDSSKILREILGIDKAEAFDGTNFISTADGYTVSTPTHSWKSFWGLSSSQTVEKYIKVNGSDLPTTYTGAGIYATYITAPIGTNIYLEVCQKDDYTEHSQTKYSNSYNRMIYIMGSTVTDVKVSYGSGSCYIRLVPVDLSVSDSPDIQSKNAEDALLDLKIDNSTTISTIQSVVSSIVDTSNYSVAVTQTGKASATESSSGYLAGTVTITRNSDGSNSSFNFNLPISSLLQGASTIYNSLLNFCSNYGATNNSSATDFTSAIKITNSAYSVTVSNWSKTNATSQSDGLLTGTVYVKQGGTTLYTIPVNKVIPKLSDSVAMAKSAIANAVTGFNANNNTDATTILSIAQNAVNTNYITVTGSGFSKTNATETSKGSISYTLNITDKLGGTDSYVVSLPLDYASQSLSTASSNVLNILNTMTITNSITDSNINTAVSKGVDTNLYNVSTTITSKTSATSATSGSATVKVVITDKSNATNTTTVTDTLPIARLEQSASTASVAIQSLVNTMTMHNNMTASEIKSLVSSVLDSSVSSNVVIVSSTNATDTTLGSLTGYIDLSDSLGDSSRVSINRQIPYLAESANSAKASIISLLNRYNATNSTTQAQMLSDFNSVIDTSEGISVNITKFTKTNATETSTGSIVVSATISDSTGATATIPDTTLVIDGVDQSIATVESLYTSFVSNLNPTNAVTSTILHDGVLITNQNITATVTGFTKTNATDTSEGSITASIVISQSGYSSRTVTVNKVIPRLNETLSTTVSKVNTALSNYIMSNSTTSSDIINVASSAVDTLLYNVTATITGKTLATSATSGSATVTVTITDKNNATNTQTIIKTMPIARLEQTATKAGDIVQSIVDNMLVYNNITSANIKSLISASLDSSVTSNVTITSLTNATDKAKGSLVGTVVLTDGVGATYTVHINREIPYLVQSASSAKSVIESILSTYNPTNATTATTLLASINSAVDVSNGLIVTNTGFTKTNATETSKGNIIASFSITDSYGGTATITNYPIAIETLNQSLSTVQSLYVDFVDGYTVSNSTTAQDILDGVLITNQAITATMSGFTKTNATDLTEGSIVGTITIAQSGYTSKTVAVNKVIPRLAQSLSTAVNNVSTTLANYILTNSTSTSDIISAVSSGVDTLHYTVSATITGKTSATTATAGSATVNITITDKSNASNTQVVSRTLSIARLEETASKAGAIIQSVVNNMVVYNNMSSANISTLVSTALDSSVTSNVVVSSITNATDKATGTVVGYVDLTDKSGGTYRVNFSRTIPYLSQYASSAKSAVQALLSSYKASNSTTVGALLASCNSVVATSNGVVVTNTKFVKTNATETATGSIVVSFTITDAYSGSDTIIDYSIPIVTLDQTIDTVQSLFNTYITNLDVSNATTSADLLSGVLITNENIHASVTSFTKTNSTDLVEGSLVATITITQSGYSNRTVSVNKVIPRINQSLSTAVVNTNAILNGYILTNSTNSANIVSAVSSGVDTLLYNVTATITGKISATSATAGSATVNVTITDKNNATNTQTVSKLLTIARLEQTASTAGVIVQNIVNNMFVYNNMTSSQIQSLVSTSLDSSVTSTTTVTSLVNATDSTKGSIVGYVDLTDKSLGTYRVNFNREIGYLSQDADSAKTSIESLLSVYKATNSTTALSLLTDAKEVVDIANGVVVTNTKFVKIDATETTTGSIVASFNITDAYSGSSTIVDYTITIGTLSQSIDTVKNLYTNYIGNLNANNSTTSSDLLSGVLITNQAISASVQNFSLTPATDLTEGLLTGTIVIKQSGQTDRTVTINKVVPRVYQTLGTAINNVNNILSGYTMTNGTSTANLVTATSAGVDTLLYNVTATITGKVLATSATEGTATVTITVTSKADSSLKQTTSKVLAIARLEQSATKAGSTVQSIVNNMVVYNNMTSANIIALVNASLDSSVVASVNLNPITNATDSSLGSVSGTVELTDKVGGTYTVTFTRVIPYLSQSADSAKDNILALLSEFKPTNSTTSASLLNSCKNIVDVSNGVTVTNTKFSKVNSSENIKGSIVVSFTITDTYGNTATIDNYVLTIDVLYQSIDTINNLYTTYISNINPSNSLTAQDLYDGVLVTNQDITVTVTNFNKTNATDSVEGYVSADIVISQSGYANKVVHLGKIIPRLYQTLATATSRADSIITDYTLTNSTTNTDLVNAVSSGVDTLLYNVSVSISNKTSATSATKGTATVTVTITDKNNSANKQTITKNLDIARLELSAIKASALIQTMVDNMSVYNNMSVANINNVLDGSLDSSIVHNTVITTLTNATDLNKGILMGYIDITDSTGATARVNFSRQIPYLTQLASSAKTLISNMLSNYTATNSSSLASLEYDCNNIVSTANGVHVTVTAFTKTEATEVASGNIICSLSIVDAYGNNETLTNVELPIITLAQSRETVQSLYASYTNSMLVSNTTTATQILNGVLITNEYITATLDNLSKVDATDLAEGSINGTILIHQNGFSDLSVPFSRVIPRVNQTVYTAKSNIITALNNLAVSNNTTQGDYETVINNSIDTLVTSYSISNFVITPATETSRGLITGVINITDSSNNKESVNILSVIDYLPQSVTSVANLYTNKLKNYIAFNTTVQSDIISLVDISNSDITVQYTNYFLDPAIDTRQGKLTGILVITNNKTGESKTVSVNVPINFLSQELATAVSLAQNYIGSVTPTNSVNFTSILNQVNTIITNPNISASWDYGTTNIPEKLATETSSGSINKVMLITDSTTGIEVQVPVVYTIPKLQYTVNGVKSLVSSLISSYSATNYTNKENLLNYLTSSIPDIASSSVSIDITGFTSNSATEISKGYLDGTVVITDGVSSDTVSVGHKEIGLIPQTIEGVADLIASNSQSLSVSNSTTNSSLLNDFKSLITGTSGSKILITLDAEDFSKINATIDNTGLINANVQILDNDLNRLILPVSIVIPKTAQTVEDALTKANSLINSYTATNSTTKDSLLSYLSTVITGTSGSIITIDIDSFNKINATENNAGAIKGVLKITDDKGVSAEENVNIPISRLVVDTSTTSNRISSVLSSLDISNGTTSDDIINQIYDLTGLPKDATSITIEAFNKVKATSTSVGSITGTIKATTGSHVDLISLNLPIVNTQIKDEDIASNASEILQELKSKIEEEHASVQSADDIISLVKNIINNPLVTVTVSNLDLTTATFDNNGSASCTLNFTSPNSSFQTDTGEMTITKIPLTSDEKINRVISEINSIISTTPAQQQSWSSLKHNIDSIVNKYSGVTVDYSSIIEKEPVDGVDGSITGLVKLTCETVTKDLTLSVVIGQSNQNIVNNIADEINIIIGDISLGDVKSTDDLDKLLNDIRNQYPNASIDLSNLITVEPTKDSDGSIRGNIIVTVGDKVIEIPVNITIPQTDKNKADAILDSIGKVLDSANTDLIKSIEDLDALLDNIRSTYPEAIIDTSKVNITLPTADENGSITGSILVTVGDTSEGYNITIVLAKDIEAQLSVISQEIQNKILSNELNSIDNYNNLISSLESKYPSISFDTSSVKATPATTTSTGSIVGNIVLTGDGHTLTVPINITIPKVVEAPVSGGGGGGIPVPPEDTSTTPVVITPTTTSVDTSNSTEVDPTYMSNVLGLTVNVKVVQYTWTAYKGDTIVNQGNLQAIYQDGSMLGVSVNANSPLDNDTKIDISFLGGDGLDTVYVYNPDVDKYVQSGTPVTSVDGKVTFAGNNKSSYLVTKGSKSDNIHFIANGWYNSNSIWYLIDDATCKSGWVYQGSNWYYFDPITKQMKTGWLSNNSTWYYLSEDTTSLGAMQTGWKQVDDSWYYLKGDGSNAVGWVYSNSNWYYTDTSGKMKTGWVSVGGNWYYFNSYGAMEHDTYIDGYELSWSGAMI